MENATSGPHRLGRCQNCSRIRWDQPELRQAAASREAVEAVIDGLDRGEAARSPWRADGRSTPGWKAVVLYFPMRNKDRGGWPFQFHDKMALKRNHAEAGGGCPTPLPKGPSW